MNDELRLKIYSVLKQYEVNPISPSGGFVRYPREYIIAAPAWTLAGEIADACCKEE